MKKNLYIVITVAVCFFMIQKTYAQVSSIPFTASNVVPVITENVSSDAVNGMEETCA